MRTFLADHDPSVIFRSRIGEYDFADRPGLAWAYAVSGTLMELLGPIFWAALVVLLVLSELNPG